MAFALYSIYVLSGFANDWALHLFGVKAYLSTITLFLLPLLWLFSGQAWRGLRSSAGLCWAGFLLWMLIATPFSVWQGGSAAMLANYVPRAYCEFFYTASFVTSLRQCRRWMYLQIASGAALLVDCWALGTATNARFRVPGSLFYGNSNDLALALLLAITSFLFLLQSRSKVARFGGVLGIFCAVFYAFRTGSRGGVISGCALLLFLVCFSRAKWKFAVFGAATLGIAFASGTSSALHRLSQEDDSSVASQEQRRALLATSLRYTFEHPLFGVGPDQFAAAVSRDDPSKPWLGTHNTYTQISSECGIPALIFYVGAIVICLRSNLQLYRRTRDPHIAAVSQCLLAGTLVFAVSAFFFHMAYSAYLPELAGFSVSLRLLRGNEQPARELGEIHQALYPRQQLAHGAPVQ